MAKKKDAKSPATTSSAHDIMAPRLAKVDAILGGTEAMHAAGKVLLPLYENETEKNYANRLAMAVLFNQAELTLDSWVGRPFSEIIKRSEDMPDEIDELLEDVDAQGNSLQVYARQWFRDGLGHGLSHTLVDMPNPEVLEDDARRTAADDEGMRPYWVQIHPGNVLFAHFETRDGKDTLVHLRIAQQVVEKVGFAEVVLNQIRLWDLPDEVGGNVIVTLWEEKPKAKQNEDKWVVKEEPSEIEIDEIPFVTYYGGEKQDHMVARPALESLVDLNIAHWRSDADQTNILTVARFPILAGSGTQDSTPDGGEGEGQSNPIGPRTMLHSPDVKGKFYYVEHTGAAIAAGATNIENLETRMAQYGAEFLRKRPGNETATARALDSAESTSPLQDSTLRFVDAANEALRLTGKWADVEKPGTVALTTDFGPEELNDADLTALGKARTERDLSRPRLIAEYMRRGTLPEDFDEEQNERELKEEENNEPKVEPIVIPDDDPDNPDNPDDPENPDEPDPEDPAADAA